MKVGELIEKLSVYDSDMEVALGDLQFNCFDKNVAIIDEYKYQEGDNELLCKEDFSDEEWKDLNSEQELSKILILV